MKKTRLLLLSALLPFLHQTQSELRGVDHRGSKIYQVGGNHPGGHYRSEILLVLALSFLVPVAIFLICHYGEQIDHFMTPKSR
jgi:hypothetical protein